LEDLPSNLRHDKHNNKKVRHYKFPSSRIDRQSQNDKNLSNPEVQYVSENVFRQGESNIQKLNIFGSPPIKVKNFKTATDGFEVDLKKLSSKISQDNQQLREILTSPKKDGSSIKILRKEKPIWFQRLTMDKFSADENKFKDNFLKINETLINQQLDHLKSQFLFYEYNKFDDDLMNTIGSIKYINNTVGKPKYLSSGKLLDIFNSKHDPSQRTTGNFEPLPSERSDCDQKITKKRFEYQEELEGQCGKKVSLLNNEKDPSENSIKKFGWSITNSDKIPLDRLPADLRMPECKSIDYPPNLPKAIIIFVFHNEAWTTLLRSVHTVIRQTPERLISQILLMNKLQIHNFKTTIKNLFFLTISLLFFCFLISLRLFCVVFFPLSFRF